MVKEGREGTYHGMARCVRRAFLCGYDEFSGKDYEHRKEWMRLRLKELAGIFAVDACDYAVMSNHLHVILRNRPDWVESWSNEEVATHNDRSITVPMIADNQWHTYTLDMSQNPEWTDHPPAIMRIEPTNVAGAHFEIDYIRTTDAPVPGTFAMPSRLMITSNKFVDGLSKWLQRKMKD